MKAPRAGTDLDPTGRIGYLVTILSVMGATASLAHRPQSRMRVLENEVGNLGERFEVPIQREHRATCSKCHSGD